MTEAKFVVNGEDVAIPAIDTFTMDEAMVLYDYSRMTLDEVAELESLHPGFVAALLHVGIARANPAMKAKEIKRLVSGLNLFEILAAMESGEAEADADVPPTSAVSEPQPIVLEPKRTGDVGESIGDDLPETSLRAIGSQV